MLERAMGLHEAGPTVVCRRRRAAFAGYSPVPRPGDDRQWPDRMSRSWRALFEPSAGLRTCGLLRCRPVRRCRLGAGHCRRDVRRRGVSERGKAAWAEKASWVRCGRSFSHRGRRAMGGSAHDNDDRRPLFAQNLRVPRAPPAGVAIGVEPAPGLAVVALQCGRRARGTGRGWRRRALGVVLDRVACP